MRFQNNFPQYFYLSYGGQFSERRNWRNRSVFHMSLKFLSHNVIACPWLATGRWFSPDIPVSPTNKTDHHEYSWNIVESGVKHHKPTNLPHNAIWSADCIWMEMNAKANRCCYKFSIWTIQYNYYTIASTESMFWIQETDIF